MSNIGWTDETWNPVTGCTRVSAGCDHCYAATMSRRMEAMGVERYRGVNGRGHFNGVVRCHEEVLIKPMRWRKPRQVFVCSMSDLFHEGVPSEFIDAVFAVMALCPQHTFQVLTKRPERMAEYVRDERTRHAVIDYLTQLRGGNSGVVEWPLPNIWLGTSVEDQTAVDERIGSLLQCPAAVRFLSCEPLLGNVRLDECAPYTLNGDESNPGVVNAFSGVCYHPRSVMFRPVERAGPCGITWVIVGCESRGGRVGRLLAEHDGDEAAWWKAAESIRDECLEAGVAFFLKQGPGDDGRVDTKAKGWPKQFPLEGV